jgi:hypothetical protein
MGPREGMVGVPGAVTGASNLRACRAGWGLRLVIGAPTSTNQSQDLGVGPE